MGEIINFLSSLSPDLLPVGTVQGVLFNTPALLKSPSEQQNATDIIRLTKASYKMLDSGGYQLFTKIKDNSLMNSDEIKTLFIMNEALPIEFKNYFNLTPAHVLQALNLITFDFVISPDRPIRSLLHPDESQFLFLEATAFNEYGARRLSELIDQHNLSTKMLVAVQAHNIQQMGKYLSNLEGVKFAGLSFPRRIMSPEKLVVYLLKSHLLHIDTVHLLGTTRFIYYCILVYMARHLFNFVSIDSTNISKFSLVSTYLEPFTLRTISLRPDSTDDLSLRPPCSCPWCSYYKKLSEIYILTKVEKFSLLIDHNNFVINQLIDEAYGHADSAKALCAYLTQVAGSKKDDIARIYELLSLVEAVISYGLNDNIIDSLWNRLVT